MLSNQRSLLAAFPILLVGGCVAKPPAGDLAGFPAAASFFICAPSDGYGGLTNAQSVEIDPTADADAIMIRIGNGRLQRLNVVSGSGGRLFANAAYGWRLVDPAPVLTDIESFQTYRCAPR